MEGGIAPATPALSSIELLVQLCEGLGKRVSFAEHHVGIEVLENYYPSKILEIDSCYDGDGDDDGKSIKHQDDDINGDVDSDGDGANSLMHRNDDL